MRYGSWGVFRGAKQVNLKEVEGKRREESRPGARWGVAKEEQEQEKEEQEHEKEEGARRSKRGVGRSLAEEEEERGRGMSKEKEVDTAAFFAALRGLQADNVVKNGGRRAGLAKGSSGDGRR